MKYQRMWSRYKNLLYYITHPRVLFRITTRHWFRYGNKAADDGPFSHFQCSQKQTSSKMGKLLISERKIQQVRREKGVKFAVTPSALALETPSSINYLHKTHPNIWHYLKTCHYVTAISVSAELTIAYPTPTTNPNLKEAIISTLTSGLRHGCPETSVMYGAVALDTIGSRLRANRAKPSVSCQNTRNTYIFSWLIYTVARKSMW